MLTGWGISMIDSREIPRSLTVENSGAGLLGGAGRYLPRAGRVWPGDGTSRRPAGPRRRRAGPSRLRAGGHGRGHRQDGPCRRRRSLSPTGNVNSKWPHCDGLIWPHLGRVGLAPGHRGWPGGWLGLVVWVLAAPLWMVAGWRRGRRYGVVVSWLGHLLSWRGGWRAAGRSRFRSG